MEQGNRHKLLLIATSNTTSWSGTITERQVNSKLLFVIRFPRLILAVKPALCIVGGTSEVVGFG